MTERLLAHFRSRKEQIESDKVAFRLARKELRISKANGTVSIEDYRDMIVQLSEQDRALVNRIELLKFQLYEEL